MYNVCTYIAATDLNGQVRQAKRAFLSPWSPHRKNFDATSDLDETEIFGATYKQTEIQRGQPTTHVVQVDIALRLSTLSIQFFSPGPAMGSFKLRNAQWKEQLAGEQLQTADRAMERLITKTYNTHRTRDAALLKSGNRERCATRLEQLQTAKPRPRVRPKQSYQGGGRRSP